MNQYPLRLSELRKAKNLKQSDVADLLKITTRHYQEVEYGKINLSMTTLIKLANFYDVSIDYLVGRMDSPKIYR